MEILFLNKDNFDDSVRNKTILLAFYAEWCPPCKALSVVLERFSKEEKSIRVAKVNVDNDPELASKYGVYSVPTLVLFKNGEVIKTESGFKSKEGLKKFIEN